MSIKPIPQRHMDLYISHVNHELEDLMPLHIAHEIAKEETERAMRLEFTNLQIRLNQIRADKPELVKRVA